MKIWRGFKFGGLADRVQSAKFCSANLNSYVTAEKMALLRYLKRKRPGDEITLPRVEDCNSASISKKELEAANKEVKKILLSKGESKARGKYNVYTSEERAAIGKYAAENGAARASRHFSKVFGNVNESTARRLKVEYLQKVKETSKEDNCDMPVVKALATKQQGRPLLLGKNLDTAVQEFVNATRKVGLVINTDIVEGAAKGIIAARDILKLAGYGGHIVITKGWAKSLLKRMGYVKRKASNAGKVSVAQFQEVKEVFLADIAAEVLMNDIPDDLIFNWDQTGLQLVPTGEWTMHKSGDKIIPIAHVDDKRQITAVLAATITGISYI